MNVEQQTLAGDGMSTSILAIAGYQKPYIKKLLFSLMNICPYNVQTICSYISAEQTECGIRESTKEGKIKCLVRLSAHLNHKNFTHMGKADILSYLNSLKKSESVDPAHKSIGTYNGRQMILLKFFRWLHNPNEPDSSKRITPPCMSGIKRLRRREMSSYRPSDLWTQEEHLIFLKYCPSKRDRAFHSMAIDTSARPHELLNLKIEYLIFKRAVNGAQYAEILVCGKTKSRTLPLIASIPYIKEYLNTEHPHGGNPKAWLFVSFSKLNRFGQITRDGLLKRYEQQYRDRYFPALLLRGEVPERDKAFIKNLLTKPWNLYVFRHSSLTDKSQILKEHSLRSHAGWSTTSKMPQVYIHYFGNESSTSLLEAQGIITKGNEKKNLLSSIQCTNCSEPNKPDARFCSYCKMVLKYDAYSETLEEQKSTELEIQLIKENFQKETSRMREEVRQEVKAQVAKLISILKPEIVKEGFS